MEEQIKQLSVYLKEQITKGVSEDVLKNVSLGQGWSDTDFSKALAMAKGMDLPPMPSGSAPVPPPPSNSTQPNISVDSLMKNVKFVTTVKTIAIYSAAVNLIVDILGTLSNNIFFKYSLFRGLKIGSLTYTVIIGLVVGAFGGIMFYFFYDYIKSFVKKIPFVSTYIVSMFTSIWLPVLVGNVISFVFVILPLLGSLSSSVARAVYAYSGVNPMSIIISSLILVIINTVAYYFYAKKVSEKLTPYYPW